MTGYILDDLALATGLTPIGSEHHRRELSRLLRAAIDGGPTLDVPALCLSAAASSRQALAGHLAELVAAAPPGAIDLCGLTRTHHLDALRTNHPELSWPAVHATSHALSTGLPILTPDPTRYAGVPVDVLSL